MTELTVKFKTNKLLLFILRVISYIKLRPSKWFLKKLSKLHIVKYKVDNKDWKYIYVDLSEKIHSI